MIDVSFIELSQEDIKKVVAYKKESYLYPFHQKGWVHILINYITYHSFFIPNNPMRIEDFEDYLKRSKWTKRIVYGETFFSHPLSKEDNKFEVALHPREGAIFLYIGDIYYRLSIYQTDFRLLRTLIERQDTLNRYAKLCELEEKIQICEGPQ